MSRSMGEVVVAPPAPMLLPGFTAGDAVVAGWCRLKASLKRGR